MQNMTTLSAQIFLKLSIVLFSKNIIKNKRIKAWKGGPRGQKLRKKRKKAKNDHFDEFLGPPGHINLFLLLRITLKHIKCIFHTLGT